MAAMLVMERHILLNSSGIKESDKAVLLDGSDSPSGLFSTAIETVVKRSREART